MAGSAESAQRGVLDAPPPVGHGIAAKGGDEIRPGPVFRRRRPCGIEGLDAELIGRDGEIVADFQGQMPGPHLHKMLKTGQRLLFSWSVFINVKAGTPGIKRCPGEADPAFRPSQSEAPQRPQGCQEGQRVGAIESIEDQSCVDLFLLGHPAASLITSWSSSCSWAICSASLQRWSARTHQGFQPGQSHQP